jgi:hypothetical protein
MRGKRSRAVLLAVALLLVPGAGLAQAPDGLYSARVHTTGQGEENRGAAFARGLADVLVKVSGNAELAADARLAAIDPAPLVRHFTYRDLMAGIPVHDEQGTRQRPYELTIDFDPGKIDAALASLGEAAWTGTRPRIAVFVAVRNGDAGYVLSSDGTHGIDQRDSLAAAAWGAGLPIILPTAADLAHTTFSAETFAGTEPQRLAIPGGSEPVLMGRLVWNAATLGWTADWQFASHGRDGAWNLAGVSFDEAFRSGMRGAAAILSGHAPAN